MFIFLKNRNNLSQKRGFTLIEALVAITIFSSAILAMMGVLSSNLTDITYAKRRVEATYLAQEGIEYFRNMRDTFVLYQDANNNGWNDFLLKIVDCEKTQGNPGCYFKDEMDYTDNASPITGAGMVILPCPGGVCEPLSYNASLGSYDYSGLVSSGFTRKINTVVLNDHEIGVYSTVSFTYAGKTTEVVFSENLFDWQQGL